MNFRDNDYIGAYLIGSELIVQLVPLVNAAVRSIETERPKSTATHELLFQAAKIPPLGHKTFYVLKTSARQNSKLVDAIKQQQLTTVRMVEAGEKAAVTNGVITIKWPCVVHLSFSI